MSTGVKYRVVDDAARREIARLYADGRKVGDIAAAGLHETSVYRELNRGMTDELDANGRFAYDIDKAHHHPGIQAGYFARNSKRRSRNMNTFWNRHWKSSQEP